MKDPKEQSLADVVRQAGRNEEADAPQFDRVLRAKMETPRSDTPAWLRRWVAAPVFGIALLVYYVSREHPTFRNEKPSPAEERPRVAEPEWEFPTDELLADAGEHAENTDRLLHEISTLLAR